MLQIHLILYQLDDRHQQIRISQPAEHIFKNTQILVLHTCRDAVRERSQHHQWNMRILFFYAACNFKCITVIGSGHTNHQIECRILQLLPSRLLGRNLCETRRITKAEIHIFVKDLLIYTSVILQHKSIIRICYQKNIKNPFGHEVYKRSILEIQLI